ncbi:uncharacterized protein LOC131619428 [Vicia villosa]|uniref:uncharacterized protein LOC131619428 n=1 Tax=Vicia villosa TaxID=3911 RepID=UPI00273B83F6|nr:uncharacterized protein LOC131619428 [Vicia villosa]
MKWKWRILTEENAIWSSLLKHRYSHPEAKMFVNDTCGITTRDSIWWRDLMMINGCESSYGLTVSDLIYCRIHNGESTSFWFSKWVGDQNISEAYPELYAKACSPAMTVAEAGYREGSVWMWDVARWIIEPDEDDLMLLAMLSDQMQDFSPDNQGKDVFVWAKDESKGFSVKACGEEIRRFGMAADLHPGTLNRLTFMWKLNVPSKVAIFAWRLILDRLPTRDHLKSKGILIDDNVCCCAFCPHVLETSSHLFDDCVISDRIWRKISQWIGISGKLTTAELKNFSNHFEKIKAKDERLTVGVIWLAVLWNLWKVRNAIIFNGYIFNFDECYSSIILSSWKWFRTVNVSSSACNYHYWNILPLSCLQG